MKLRLLVLATVALSAAAIISGNDLSEWQRMPDWAAPAISTESQLAQITRFVSPILAGGLGNVLFEMAAANAMAKRLGVLCLVCLSGY